MFNLSKNKIYKNGEELANYQDFLEFYEFYKQNKNFCFPQVVRYFRDKLSPLGKLKKRLSFENQIKPTNLFVVNGLLKHYQKGLLDFDVFLPTYQKNLQRPFVWTLIQKQALIETILKGVKLPSISVVCFENSENRRIFEIIDGKQRLSTILSFVNDEFPIIADGFEFYFKDFDEITKEEF